MKTLDCPHCGHEHYDCEDIGPFVSYWGESGPQQNTCSNCDKEFVVVEHVDRSWDTGKTKEEIENKMFG